MGAHSVQSSEFCCELTNSSHLPGNGWGGIRPRTYSPRRRGCWPDPTAAARSSLRAPDVEAALPSVPVDMKYRYLPSGDSIGQPSAAAVLTPGAGTGSPMRRNAAAAPKDTTAAGRGQLFLPAVHAAISLCLAMPGGPVPTASETRRRRSWEAAAGRGLESLGNAWGRRPVRFRWLWMRCLPQDAMPRPVPAGFPRHRDRFRGPAPAARRHRAAAGAQRPSRCWPCSPDPRAASSPATRSSMRSGATATSPPACSIG